jgi:hypothetical protein
LELENLAIVVRLVPMLFASQRLRCIAIFANRHALCLVKTQLTYSEANNSMLSVEGNL